MLDLVCSRSVSMFFIILASLLTFSASLPDDWCVDRDPSRFHRNPSSCTSYVSCTLGMRPLINNCPGGLYFDTNINGCNYQHLVECVEGGVEESRPPIKESRPQERPANRPADRPAQRPAQRPAERPVERPVERPKPQRALTFEEKYAIFQRESAAMVRKTRKFVTNRIRRLARVARTLRGHRRSFRFVQSFLGNQPVGHGLARTAFQQQTFLQNIRQRFELNRKDLDKFIVRLHDFRDLTTPNNRRARADADQMESMKDENMCPFPGSPDNDCDANARYRSIDGSCNNLAHALWGRSNTALKRRVPPTYDDGISEPRMSSVLGRPLKSAREVSLAIMPAITRPSFSHKLIHMTFGQFLDHDLGRTAITMIKNEQGQLVDPECGVDGCNTTGIANEACIPIKIPEGDPDFTGFKNCLMFVRSQEVLKQSCNFGPREQLNQVTSYLDASQIYGSMKSDSDALRDFSDPRRGRMKVSPNPDPQYKALLPKSEGDEMCREITAVRRCFLAGDTRVNEQMGLTAIHTIFHRYHNHIEARLHHLNSHWTGERLYQEARRIVGAIWQFIIYNEHLPATLGPDLMRKYGLQLLTQGFFNAYDDHVNAEVANSFQTAAFRFGHSEISNTFPLGDQKYNVGRTLKLSQVFNRPTEIYNNNNPGGSGVDSILLGQMSLDAQNVDNFFAEEIKANLFTERPLQEPGTDLVSLNLQRGRDHGLPGYVFFRQWCGLGLAQTFDDLRNDIDDEVLDRLKETYEHVQDIDLYAGGIAETRVRGGLMGPTFGCIIARQFRDARVGDRFWHERQDPVTGFTEAQLSSIRRMTLARIMCNTMDNVDTIQKYVMLNPFKEALNKFRQRAFPDPYTLTSLYQGEMNERQPCSQIPDIDISLWRE